MNIADAARIDATGIRHLHWDDTFPVDPIVIARRLGVTPYLSNLGDTTSIVVHENGHTDIYLNRFESKARQRFAAAHAIGHHIERDRYGQERYTFRHWRNTASNTPHEYYADCFATHLLMPPEVIDQFVDDGASAGDLAAMFGVTRRRVIHALTTE